ncbi:hypothetical protein LC607_17675 [Nostoc sp. CHAB 5824]|nr:hypothetical protein [Nostoc sp. CHAB 5824]
MKESLKAFDLLLGEYRLNFLTDLISQVMPIFEKQGFTLEELLDGLANYVETQTEWQQAVHHIEEAATAIRKAKKEAS